MNTIKRSSSVFAAACLIVFIFAQTAISAKARKIIDHVCKDSACLEIADNIFNAGTVIEGDIIQHDFTLRNTGGRALTILKVKPGCGCTDVRFDRIIMPGSEGIVHVVFNTLKKTGMQKRAIKIFCNDRHNPVTKLHIIARVLDAVILRPVDRIFLSGETGQKSKKTIEILRPGKKAFTLAIEKNMMPEEVNFSLKKKKNTYFAVFTARAGKPGIFRGRIILKTDRWQRPYIAIPVLCRIYERSRKYQ